MKESLFQLAKDYVGVIEKIAKTGDLEKLQTLEEKRAELHWKLIEMLKKQGIKYSDRDDAARIANQIANGEL